jgi:CRISPR-associated protein Cpf1
MIIEKIMEKKTLEKFTNKYQLSKTLRFELIPQGETLLNIEKSGLLKQDEQRAENYKLTKKIIDEYHKDFINKVLDGLKLKDLDEYFDLYKIAKRDDSQKKQFEDAQCKLRKQIAERFTKHPNQELQVKFKNLFNKELIKVDLLNFVKTADEILLVKGFENFTTYFTGFNENRANMYSAEDKSTAIGFRLVHQNLPKFIDNKGIFEKVLESPVHEKFPLILSELESVLQVNKIEEIFDLDYFSETLTQIGIDKYNYLLGGYTSDDGKTKIQGLNEYINLYNQQVKDKKLKIAKLKPLFKQILSDRNAISFLPEEFKTDAELLESVEQLYQELNTLVLQLQNNDSTTLPILLKQLPEFDLSKIFIKNDLGLTDIAKKMFGNWGVFQQAVNADFDNNYKGKLKKETEKYEEEQNKYFKRFDSFSIHYLNQSLLLLNDPKYSKNIAEYFAQLGEVKADNTVSLFEQVTLKYEIAEETLKTYDVNNNLSQDQFSVDKIKDFLDSIKAIQHFIKPLLGKGNEPEKDEKFYSEFEKLWQILDQVTQLYNKVRNYLTRKPYSLEKIKLNFENSTLLDGWDVNKEEANASVLFVKEGNYYLGIMDKKHNKVFREIPKTKSTENYQKVNYKLLPGASKMLPKVFFSNSNIGYFAPSEEILRIRNHGSHTKNGQPQDGYDKLDFSVTDCRKIIDFFKASINKHNEWTNYGFEFKPTIQYESIDEFYREVENQGYTISYTNIGDDYINQLVCEGKLYLFKIYNKDFSPNSKGTPNMHTLYWKMLFNNDNLKDVVYKLNGQAEIFYRKRSIKSENTIIHKANQVINNKNELNTKKQSTFTYDIIKDRRFTLDKFQFHVPITLNFKAKGIGSINTDVNQEIQHEGISHIIGIDRGERHLLYLTVIDLAGNIKEQFSLNEIVNEHNGNNYKTNYHNLLDAKEGGRDEARKNWKTIETIKELKEGYLSQVIHKITELMVKYNAIVVLEDLNMGFMRGRQKVEKQVYQKFEKMLIDKLNYYVDKKKNPTEIGGSLNALQLTNKFESFQKMGKQSGFLYYVPAWNTSKMDPVTGFVNLFQIKYESIEKAQAFFGQFKAINYNSDANYFEFSFDYSQFTNKAEGTQTNWTICSYGMRIKTFRNPAKNNQWDNEEINLTEAFETLLNKYAIKYKSIDIKSGILNQTDKAFFEELIFLFKLMLQMRNSITNSTIDYLISPVANASGQFYHSDKAASNLPQNADANGAYNIARKGLWVIEQIKQTVDLRKIKLAITNKEWLAFAQKK